MADEFHTGICNGNWWNSSRGEFSDSSTPCSTALSDVGSFGWVETTETSTKSRSCEDSASVSGNSIPFQHTQRTQVADSIGSAGTGSFLTDSTAQMMGFGHSFPPTSDWSQTLLRGSARAESSFQAMLQDDQSSSLRANYPHETGEHTVTCQGFPSNSFSMDSATYGCPSTVLQGFYEHNTQPQQATFDNRSMNYPSSITYRENSSNEFSSPWSDIPHFLRNSSSSQKQQLSNQLHFSNNTPFWNASASAMNEVRSSLYPSSQTQFLPPIFDEKPSCSHLLAKPKLEEARDARSTLKKSSSEPTYKRPRIETPSPLPTFKVRKEKLGDRITALQQLVSPFGKTDTASVLYEAIEYIKFLHDQVGVLSASYMKNAMPTQHQQQNSDKSKEAQGTNQDLRSRGLCLVPISSIIPVTNDAPTDFWTPTYGGSFR